MSRLAKFVSIIFAMIPSTIWYYLKCDYGLNYLPILKYRCTANLKNLDFFDFVCSLGKLLRISVKKGFPCPYFIARTNNIFSLKQRLRLHSQNILTKANTILYVEKDRTCKCLSAVRHSGKKYSEMFELALTNQHPKGEPCAENI